MTLEQWCFHKKERLMAKVFFDTNVFLDFYQSTNDPVKLLSEIAKHKSYLVFTEQSASEFFRNRDTVLINTIEAYKKSVRVNPYTTSILQELTEHKNAIKQRDLFNIETEKVIAKMANIIETKKDDPIYEIFNSVYHDESVLKYPIEADTLDLAHKRKLLGNPPTTDSKKTICDELHWEILLKYLDDDLIFVSRDGTFKNNRLLLASEFERRTKKKLLLITDKITDALKTLGEAPEPELVSAEEQIIQESNMREPPIGTSPSWPPLQWLAKHWSEEPSGQEISRMMSEVTVPTEELRRVMAQVTIPTEEIKRVLSQITVPTDEIRRAVAHLAAPSEEIRKAIAQMARQKKELRQAIAQTASPSEEFLKTISTHKKSKPRR